MIKGQQMSGRYKSKYMLVHHGCIGIDSMTVPNFRSFLIKCMHIRTVHTRLYFPCSPRAWVVRLPYSHVDAGT